jgi:thioredoxin-like negative regulator of GroEL
VFAVAGSWLALSLLQSAVSDPVVKLDASKARRLCMSLQVRGFPTILLFRDGQEVARISQPNLTPEQV